MLRVERKDDKVQLKVDVHMPTWEERRFVFSINCADMAYASLLTAKLDETLRDAVRSAREEAYNQGYADGRGKKKRSTFFRSIL